MLELPRITLPDDVVRHLIQIEPGWVIWFDSFTSWVKANVGIQPGFVGDDDLIVGRDYHVHFQYINTECKGMQKARDGVFGE